MPSNNLSITCDFRNLVGPPITSSLKIALGINLKRKLCPLIAAITPGIGESTGFYILNYEKLVQFHKYSSPTEAFQK